MQSLPGGMHDAVCACAGLDSIVTMSGVDHAAIAALRRKRRRSTWSSFSNSSMKESAISPPHLLEARVYPANGWPSGGNLPAQVFDKVQIDPRENVSVRAMSSYTLLDLLLWAVTSACLSILAVSSLGTPPPILAAFPGADQLFHFIGYLATTFFLLLAAAWHPWRRRGPLADQVVRLLAAMVVIGIGIEVGQLAAFRRTPDALDAVVNAVGIGAAYAMWNVLRAGANLVAARSQI